ncbi:uncharacterized protein LOC108681169 isoform X2 [Hyalella azteca]|uniref:Uncharacterized protein LOC108681169 isoform X2 n=1 Tax=Hyalella azteca TaxID=294128 RepID=A0A8B7PJW2_HYAAZ|nr:uncharacterized protein LOC108681169 isoform X2 [Hyalella azteca]
MELLAVKRKKRLRRKTLILSPVLRRSKKKKALWEKNEAEKGGRKRDDSDAQQGGWSDGPPRNFTPAGRDRSPFGRDRMRSRSPVDGGRRGRGERFRGPVRGRAPRRRGNPRDSCVLPTGPVTVFDERDGYYRDDFGPPNRRYSPPRYPENEHFRRNGPGYDAGPRRPDEEHFKRNGPGFDAEPRRPDPEYMGRNGPGYDVEPRREAHVPPRAPVERRDVPVHREQSPGVSTRIAVPTDKLSGGTAGLLLTKLASCYIKDEDDSDLALNVITSLASALREYNMKKGEKKIAELLMEAELKLNTLKALKVGLKLLNNQQTPGSSAAAAAAAVATPRPIGGETPRPTTGYSTAPSWQTERNGLAPPIDPYAGGLGRYPPQGPGPVPTRDPGPHYDPRAHAVGPAAHTPHGYQPYPSDARGTELGAHGWNHPSNYNADRNRGFPAQGTGPYAAR